MANTLVDLYNAQPAAADTTLIAAVAANTRIRILKANAVNDTTTAVYISFHKVPTGGAVGDDTLIINQKVLGSRESVPLWELEGHVLETGDLLSAIAEVAGQITVHISGVVMT